MDKVYLLLNISDFGDGYEIYGIFDSYEKAEKVQQKLDDEGWYYRIYESNRNKMPPRDEDNNPLECVKEVITDDN